MISLIISSTTDPRPIHLDFYQASSLKQQSTRRQVSHGIEHTIYRTLSRLTVTFSTWNSSNIFRVSIVLFMYSREESFFFLLCIWEIFIGYET
jgi:hypothetical protein